jgi:hypothetical protein
MATAPVSRKLNLTRDQLAAFLTDQQQIRQFELLFATVDTLQVIVGTDFEFQADNAAATANEALAQINALSQVVDLNGQAEALSYLAELSKQVQALESAPPFSAPPAVTPASPTTSVQFNNGGSFGGASTFTYTSGTDTLTVGKLVSANFTSIAQGLVPASGGGTSNFLRADGTFAAPPTSAPASPTTSVQFNNAGAFGADASFTYTVGTTTLTVPTINTTKIVTNAGVSASGTNFLMQLGQGSGAGNSGGSATFLAGGSSGGASGGAIGFFSGGGSVNGSGGDITFTAGDGAGTGNAGNFTFNAGAASGTGTGGTLNIFAGQSISGTGGDVFLFPGPGPVANGSLILSDGNIILIQCQTIGVDSCMGFFNAAPVAQPTIATTAATRVAVAGTVANIGDTYDGYTLAKVVKALRNLGILA